MTPKKLSETLADAVKNREQILIVGPPGCGKTDVVKQTAAALGADLIVSHPAVSDPTDYKGLPVRAQDGSHAEFLPFGEAYRAIAAEKLTLWFVDDLGQASEAVQKALMQLLLGRRLNGHRLSDNVVFAGATNGTGHRAGVTGLLEPIKSRWDSIVHLEVSLDDWCEWAFRIEMPVELISFLRARPELLSQFEPTRELVNSPSPRTWSSVGRRVARGLVNFELFSGAVGKGAATEFMAYMDLAGGAPSIDAILLDPKGQSVPEKPGLRYLVAAGLAMRATRGNIAAAFTYLERMTQPFRVLAMRDMVARDVQLHSTETFTRWACNEGKEIFGVAV